MTRKCCLFPKTSHFVLWMVILNMQMMYFWSQFVYFYNRPLEKGIAYLPTKCFRKQKTSAQKSPATRMPCLSRARFLRYWNFWRIVSSDEMIEHHADSPRRSLHLCQNPQLYFRSLFNWREEVLDCDMIWTSPSEGIEILKRFCFVPYVQAYLPAETSMKSVRHSIEWPREE